MLHYLNYARGVAVLMVVAVHHTYATRDILDIPIILEIIGSYGRMGVQLFFVASAVTLCISASRRGLGAGQIGGFYSRRLFRIGPMYYVAVFVYFIVWQGGGEFTGPYDMPKVLANLLFLNGFYPGGQNSIVPGGWSISSEMIFYAIFPFFFYVFKVVNERFSSIGVFILVISSCVSHVLLWFLVPHLTDYKLLLGNVFYYWPPSQVPIFLVGMAFFFTLKGNFENGPPLISAALFLILTAINIAFWGVAEAHIFIPIVSAVSFCFLLVCLSHAVKKGGFIQKIGTVSYSMYLVHFIFVWYLSPPIAEFGVFILGSPTASFFLSYLVVTILALGVAIKIGWPMELASINSRLIFIRIIGILQSRRKKYKNFS